mmetsp:Transcript_66966/g.186981  ORF Transcript_66966/g.186981 Transcript_66966/m.186981 type:complete len:342 (+) Transcript_66966:926-1951(+)
MRERNALDFSHHDGRHVRAAVGHLHRRRKEVAERGRDVPVPMQLAAHDVARPCLCNVHLVEGPYGVESARGDAAFDALGGSGRGRGPAELLLRVDAGVHCPLVDVRVSVWLSKDELVVGYLEPLQGVHGDAPDRGDDCADVAVEALGLTGRPDYDVMSRFLQASDEGNVLLHRFDRRVVSVALRGRDQRAVQAEDKAHAPVPAQPRVPRLEAQEEGSQQARRAKAEEVFARGDFQAGDQHVVMQHAPHHRGQIPAADLAPRSALDGIRWRMAGRAVRNVGVHDRLAVCSQERARLETIGADVRVARNGQLLTHVLDESESAWNLARRRRVWRVLPASWRLV